MRVTDKIHRLKINFNMANDVENFVYLYIIVGEKVHLIDTGVDGTETVICQYLKKIGRNITGIQNILLTHSHPDHIGSAYAIKQLASNCKIHGSKRERAWIEDIDKQFRERPIPNFYGLVNHSISLDHVLSHDDVLKLEERISIRVVETQGHSSGCLSYYWMEEKVLFTGDAIPVEREIPIYVSARDSIQSLERMLDYNTVSLYLSAWDSIYDNQSGVGAINKAIDSLKKIDKTVKNFYLNNVGIDKENLYRNTCVSLEMETMMDNPLFKRSIYANIDEIWNG